LQYLLCFCNVIVTNGLTTVVAVAVSEIQMVLELICRKAIGNRPDPRLHGHGILTLSSFKKTNQVIRNLPNSVKHIFFTRNGQVGIDASCPYRKMSGVEWV